MLRALYFSTILLSGVMFVALITASSAFAQIPIPPQSSTINNFTQIDYPGANRTISAGINDMGKIVGMYVDSSLNQHGFLFSSGTFTPIDYPTATITTSEGINDMSQIVGMYIDNSRNQHGFLFSSGNYTSIDYPSANSTTGTAINNAGQLVGMYVDSSLNQHGFLRTTTTIHTPPEFSLVLGGAITASVIGVVVVSRKFVKF